MHSSKSGGCSQDNSRMITKTYVVTSNENICCDLSLEFSNRGGSNDRSQQMFLLRNIENYL